jgi:serine-type D-Ala-D-Ala carboxypeptidase
MTGFAIPVDVTSRIGTVIFACAVAASTACAPQRTRIDAGPALSLALAAADSLVASAIGTRTAGAVLLVARDGQLLYERAYGHVQSRDFEGRSIASPRAVRTTTMFDLASVTKVVATTTAIMLLVDRGRVDLDAPIGRYLPSMTGPRFDSMTVRHLLNHSSGLVQWQPMYYHASNAAGTLDAIRRMSLQWRIGEGRHYSDLGFMLLGYLVESVSGEPLDRFVHREIAKPLGLRSTVFNPKVRGLGTFAMTEQGNAYERQMVHDPNFGYDYAGDPTTWNGWRQYVLNGEVNDGNAFHAHGGVAGHAGLFSTAADVRIVLDLLHAGGVHDGRRMLSDSVIARFLTRDRYGHYLGWQYPADMPEGSFSHTGFTGTYVLGVPKYGLSVVLLTNRQQMGRDARGFFPDLGPLQRAISRTLVRGAEADLGR